MTIQATLAHVQALEQALADPAELLSSTGASGSAEGVQGGAGAGTFAAALSQAQAGAALGQSGSGLSGTALGASSMVGTAGYGAFPAQGVGAGSGAGARVVAAAESQIGQTEQPPGSNESPAIAEYRGAVASSAPGEPWCAYFASWAARAAGEPLGTNGEGLGSVAGIWSWAQSSGRAIANGPGVVPAPGDLMVFGDQHVGIVRGVLPDGRIETIEGNYENKVATNTRSPSEATGYVNLS